jgi:hypothetical protein
LLEFIIENCELLIELIELFIVFLLLLYLEFFFCLFSLGVNLFILAFVILILLFILIILLEFLKSHHEHLDQVLTFLGLLDFISFRKLLLNKLRWFLHFLFSFWLWFFCNDFQIVSFSTGQLAQQKIGRTVGLLFANLMV